MSEKHILPRHDGAAVPYWIYNPGGDTTIVGLHGFRGTHHGLERLAKSLPEFRFIVPDMPGFGEHAPLQAEHNLEGYSAFVKEFLEALKLSAPPVLLGHSFGSIVASHFAAHNPEAVQSLILINPIGAPALEGPRSLLTKLAVLYYWLGKKLPARTAHTWLSLPPIVDIMSLAMTKTKDREIRRFVRDQHREHFSTFADSISLSQAFHTSISHTVHDVAARLTPPTLLIVGAKDDITPLAKQYTLSVSIKDSRLVILEDVGHLIHYEKATEAAEAIRDFVQPVR